MTEFEWDEAKRQANRAKHRLDFLRARLLFDGRPVLAAEGVSDQELRFRTTGLIASKFCTVIWTLRGDRIRIISFRRARDEEKRQYRQLHGGGN